MALLNAFNGKVNMTEAFGWDGTQIRQEFDKMLSNMGPDGYNVETNSQSSFQQAIDDIKKLVGGTGKTVFLDKPIKYKYQGIEFGLETLFDIVGWIFSVTGTTPTGANNQNYYWPLGALYFVFCRRLINNQAKDPSLIQLTYFQQKDNVWRVAVGATMDRPKRQRKETARLNRAKQMKDEGLITEGEMTHVSYVDVPDGDEPQRFGHCGETFPCLLIHGIRDKVTLTTAGGFASLGYLAFPNPDSVYNEGLFSASRLDPCNNCRTVTIPKSGMDPQRFLV
ncbi:hypothetical protein AX17_002963 [Amanita inopinata Kibby_2008]|nr:hypothetical protein AX17_002963 [Amanita inopinata Kibby_2008]